MRPPKLAVALLILAAGQLFWSRAPSARIAPSKPFAALDDVTSPDDQVIIAEAPLPVDRRLAPPPWATRMAELLSAEPPTAGEVGVYVRHLASGEEFSWRAEEPWYLASGVKVPVAIAVLRKTERGELPWDVPLPLADEDRVDGTGHTNGHPPGSLLKLDYLLEQMLVYSDNTATDLLIREVGLGTVNALATELGGHDFRITTLADVRRMTYRALHADAERLGFRDWVALRHTPEGKRPALVARLANVSADELTTPSLDAAYERFYRTEHNTGPLSAYGQLLTELAEGRALSAEATAYLLGVMSRIRTGKRRIQATLPPRVEFAHKTGTQHRRLCDLGIVNAPASPVVVAACARHFPSVTAGERALRGVGQALTASGVLDLSPHLPRRDDEATNIASHRVEDRNEDRNEDRVDPGPGRDERSAELDLRATLH